MDRMPTTSPIFTISFCLTRFVENASALGGVLMGRTIALEEAIATPISIVGVPPIMSSLSPIAVHKNGKPNATSDACGTRGVSNRRLA